MKAVYLTDALTEWGWMERVLVDKMNVLAGQYGWDVTLTIIPLIVESHTLCNSENMNRIGLLYRLYIRFFKSSIRKSDAVVALIEGDANYSKNFNNVHLVPNIVHLNAQRGRSLILFMEKDIKRPLNLIYNM